MNSRNIRGYNHLLPDEQAAQTEDGATEHIGVKDTREAVAAKDLERIEQQIESANRQLEISDVSGYRDGASVSHLPFAFLDGTGEAVEVTAQTTAVSVENANGGGPFYCPVSLRNSVNGRNEPSAILFDPSGDRLVFVTAIESPKSETSYRVVSPGRNNQGDGNFLETGLDYIAARTLTASMTYVKSLGVEQS